MLHTFIDMIPVAKGRPRFGNGRTFTPEATKIAQETIQYEIGKLYRGEPYEGAIRARMTFFMPIPKSYSEKKQKELAGEYHTKRPDSDNLAKLVLDALNGIVYKDDAQIAELMIRKIYSNTPKISIHITKL